MLKIFIFSDWYSPAYKAGGPITSLNNLVNSLSAKLNCTIITSAYDLGENKILQNVISDSWQSINNYKIKYLTNPKTASDELVNPAYDFIYLNSMFSPSFTIRPLLKARSLGILHKVILAPRGMLAEGALSLKPFKKKLYLFLFKLLRLPGKIIFHATSEQEVKDIKRIFGNSAKIKFIPNFPSKPEAYSAKPLKLKNELKLISIARIAQEKNTLFLLELLKAIKGNVSLDIYGMIKTESYLQLCRNVISRLPTNVKVNINGEIPFYEVKVKLSEHHFFILPTLGENFGHAIYEALGSGTPVIISDKTPWRNLEQQKAGWDIPLDNKNKFVQVLNKCCEMDNDEYQLWSKGAHNFAKKYYEENDPTEEYLKMFGVRG